MQDKTVIIIGAGIAGITAAQMLEALGYSVIILEARSDFGGRIRLNNKIGVGPMLLHEAGPFEAEGGIKAYIEKHPEFKFTEADLPPEQPITNLLAEYEIPTWQTMGDWLKDGIVVGENSKNFKIMDLKTQYEKYRLEYQNYFVELPISHVSLEDEYAKALIVFFEEAYSGLSIEELAEIMKNSEKKGLEFFKYGNDHVRLENDGYYKLIKKMQAKLKNTEIHLNTVVSQVEYSARKAVVTDTSGKKFEASAVISTIPIGALKKGTVKFQNLSKEKAKSIQNLTMGVMNVVILKFDKIFWNVDNTHFFVIDTTPRERALTLINNVNKFSQDKEPTLLGCFFALDAMRDKALLIQDTKQAIKKAWPEAPDPIFEAVTAWHLDPYTYGSYASFSKDTHPIDIVNLMDPEWEGRLIFAGDAYIPVGLMGCVHGAYISGRRAARLIHESLSEH